MDVDLRLSHAVRAGGTAVIAASALMALASTSQTPHGFVNANFGAPLSIFGVPTTTELQPDVLAIGDGSADAAELAELLQSAGSPTEASAPFQVPEGAPPAVAPGTPEVVVLPVPADLAGPGVSAPTSKQSLRPVPMVDVHGRVDCSGSVSCKTDPKTKTTTVTYSDGTVALVQQVNDMTLIAYEKVKDTVQGVVQALVPGATPPLPAAAIVAAPAPTAAAKAAVPVPAAPAPAATPAAPTAPAPVRAIDPGPPAPEVTAPDISASTVRPRLTVSTPPEDFSPGSADGASKTPRQPVPPALRENIDKVADAVGSAVNKIGEAVGKALNPGAATKPAPSAPKGANADTGAGADAE